jgi:predicted O-methyltransferase YrrM
MVWKILEWLILPLIVLSAPLYYLIAKTGIGIAICRRFRFHPVLVSFYQPVPEYESLPENYFRQKQDLPGVSMKMPVIRACLAQLAQFAPECNWPENKTAPQRYYWRNQNFSYSSACILHAMIRANRTRKIIEIGSGFSSLIALEALKLNHPSGQFELRCIEPYPSLWLVELARQNPSEIGLVRKKAQELAPEFFADLEANDILFIDSSHVAKLASDVNFLFLRVLPRLKRGVIIHVHDIYTPYDYPREHFFGRTKIFWNEQYLLQAFLSGNKDFEIVLPCYFLQTDSSGEFKKTFPLYDPAIHRATSSFWMKKISDPAAGELKSRVEGSVSNG